MFLLFFGMKTGTITVSPLQGCSNKCSGACAFFEEVETESVVIQITGMALPMRNNGYLQ